MYVERKEPIHTMEVFGERPPMLATVFFMSFAVIAFLVPFVIAGILISSGGGMKLGYLISSAVFFAIAYYFFRMASWNYNGVELIEIFEDEVVYQAHTKWLTLSTHKLELEGCILVHHSEENGKVLYGLRNAEQTVDMRFHVDSEKLYQFQEVLDSRNGW